MNNKDSNKKTSIFSSIIWMIPTFLWSFTAYRNYNKVGVAFWLVFLQVLAALASFARAIYDFIRYKQS